MQSQEQKTPVATVGLLITRDAMTIIPSTVPTYEADVVRAVFGDDNVQTLDEASPPTEVDLPAEADRLKARYGEDKVIAAHGANFKPAINKAAAEAAKAAGKAAKQAA